MLSGGRVHLGGGHALQQKFNIKDLADSVFTDWVRFDAGVSRYSDRDMVRVFADENVPTFNFLIENGVSFIEKPVGLEAASTVPATSVTVDGRNRGTDAPGGGRNGSGLVRSLETKRAPRKAWTDFSAAHEMKKDHPRGFRKSHGSIADPQHPGRDHNEHPGAQGRHHRDRWPYRQRQLPPHLRTAAATEEYRSRRVFPMCSRAPRANWLPWIWARRCGQPQTRPTSWVRPPHQDPPHRHAMGLQLARVPAREQTVRAGESDRPDGQRLAGHDFHQFDRQALLERGRRFLPLLRRGTRL